MRNLQLLSKINHSVTAPLEVFQKQSYSSCHSGQSLAWDHFQGVITNPCSIIAIPVAIGGDAVGDEAIVDSAGADADH